MKKTKRQDDGFTYIINNTQQELGAYAEFLTLEKSDITDVYTIDYVGAAVIGVYER